MPTYEFTCTICGSQFEKTFHFSENPTQIVCPHGHTQIRKRFSVPSVVYRGKGFYVTDNRKKETSSTK